MRLRLLLLCGTLAAAPPPAARPTQVRIPVWLDAASGDPPAQDFHATIDGSDARVIGVQCPDSDVIILLVLDISSGDLTVMDPAKATAEESIRKLPPNAYVGLLRAQDSLQVLEDPIADRDAITHRIEEQTLTGRTGLLATVESIGRIADAMLDKSTVRVAILYVTDGDVRNYREDFTNPVINSSDSHDLSRRFPEALVQEKIAKLDAVLAAQQAPLFIVDLNPRTDRLNNAYHNGLKQLAETTGGAAFFSRSTTEIPEAIRKSFETVQSHYSLTLALPERVPPRLLIRLTVPENHHLLSYRTRLALRRR
ncbi:MAG TPA: hypothetical protein VK335_30705 [Bryobacteraceae bacterium]|nr:hypothetical protein [Bryobacteraceae bacterium]